ncbi:transposase [Longilinea arvoryzae]|uniref:Transposase n=1 Tax=Longilinea arvoryzae TaxID=360412 RepID=A0A0S7B7C3_9CHLR|nr:transposase [Longilinea arvoryzae]GAP12942.1 transposase [Longilinea arvoryzae]
MSHAPLPNRRSIRLPGYDYTFPTAYFITILTWQRKPVLGTVIDHAIQLSETGTLAQREWLRLAQRFTQLELDEFVVMPDHVHGILLLKDVKNTQYTGANTPDGSPSRPHVVPGSLGAIVRAYKSTVARLVNFSRFSDGEPFWQRNYFERVVSDERDIERIREYIRSNPLNWPKES